MDIKIPEVGESVREALVARWLKKSGETVNKDEPLCELETDKITLELTAESSGLLAIAVPEGETVKIGTVIGSIDEAAATPPSKPVSADSPAVSPAARKLAAEQGIDTNAISGRGRGGRVTLEDVIKTRSQGGNDVSTAPETPRVEMVRSEEPVQYGAANTVPADDRIRRVTMTPIRRRIAERLLAVRQQTAMVTTFNEADLSRIIELRKRHNEQFAGKHGVRLGFMSFFVKACCEALKEFPAVNASIDGYDIVYHEYYNIGVAIGSGKGLVVPVLRDADTLHFHQIELQIEEFGAKAKENRLAIAELEGGTFTISNGGVYGSLLSTPLLNPPQSAVLGMHAIQERPVAIDGQIAIRPMMYLALSYDHRIIDGREAVQFLKKVREYVEDPEELFLEG